MEIKRKINNNKHDINMDITTDDIVAVYGYYSDDEKILRYYKKKRKKYIKYKSYFNYIKPKEIEFIIGNKYDNII